MRERKDGERKVVRERENEKDKDREKKRERKIVREKRKRILLNIISIAELSGQPFLRTSCPPVCNIAANVTSH